MTDAKEMWEEIKSRFGGNDESKKMQKYILKQQFESFSVSNSKGLHKGYDRFQGLLSQLETHGASVSTEDANQKFLRECRLKRNQDNRRRDARNTGYKAKDNGKRLAKHDEHKAMVTIDGEDTSDKDKSGIRYGSQIHDGVLSYDNEVFASVFDSRFSDVEDSLVNDRFAKVKGMHVVSPPMIGNYMPPKSDFGIVESKFTYGPKQSTSSESDAKTSDLDSCDSSSSEETLETVAKPVESKPKVVNEPKVWPDTPIIEEYESDSDDEYVSKASVEQKNLIVLLLIPFSNLIRDCDFHEKRMAKQVELNKQKGKSYDPTENRPVWNNVQRLNHKNKFVLRAVLTKNGKFPINAARQNFTSQAASTRTARKVNTARPKVNEIRPRHNVYKSHSPIRRPFNETTTPKLNFAQLKVNIAGDKSDTPHQTLKEKCIIDSGCSRTGTLLNSVGQKGIKREYSNARTPQQNGVAVRKNRTLIEANRTMLADSFLPNTFWDEAVSTTCYVLNRVLVTKPQNKTPYELLTGKFKEKSNEGFLVGYSLSSKAFRPITAENKDNKTAGPKETNNSAAETLRKMFTKSTEDLLLQARAARASSTNYVNIARTPVNTASTPLNTCSTPTNQDDSQIPSLEDIYEVSRDGIFTSASYDDESAVVDFTNLETTVNVSPIPTSRIHSIHPTKQILGDPTLVV
nr:ribonuclease H-like domain-containing protein [Tanacetum cinerariifolium]